MQSEDNLLARCHIWIWNNYSELRFCCWHVANERKTTKQQGARLKSKGVVPGVPDYVVNYNGKTYYFEMKTKKGILSENQKRLHKYLENQGFKIYIIRDFEIFQKIIKDIIK